MNIFIKNLQHIKSSRSFDQSWKNYYYDYYNPKQNVLTEFCDYNIMLYKDLLTIKDHYKDYFNLHSQVAINDVIDAYNSLYEVFVNILCDKKSYLQNRPEIKSKTDWLQKGRFWILSFDKYLRSESISVNADYSTINNETYKKLNILAKSIFGLEEYVASITKNIWQTSTTKVDNYDKNNFAFVARQFDSDAAIYLDNLLDDKALKVTYFNDKKTKLPNKDLSPVGLIYDLNDSFIAASNTITGLIQHKKNEYNNIFSNVCLLNTIDDKNIYGLATKTATPKSITLKYSDAANEVIINAKKTKPVAIFYVCSSDKNFYIDKKKQIDKISDIKMQYDLPVIELEDINKFFINKNLEI